MKTQDYSLRILILFVFAISLAGCDALGSEPYDSPSSAEPSFFSIPKTQWPGFTDMVIDPSGTVWIMANNRVFYLADGEFREPVTGPMHSGSNMAVLYGGEGREAYATVRGKDSSEGLLYRLSDGGAHFVTSFKRGALYNYPGLYVSNSGKVFNWDDSSLACLTTDGWEMREAYLGPGLHSRASVFDLGTHVYFYYDNHLYRYGSDGFLAMTPPQWHSAQPGRNRILGVRWGKTRALLLDYGKQDGIFAFDLVTCREVPLDAAHKTLSTTSIYDAFSHPDGSVWLLGITRGQTGHLFFRLGTDGMVEPILSMGEIPWDNTRCWLYPKSILVRPTGEIVFGLPEDGIAIWQDGKIRLCRWSQELATGVNQILEDQRGYIWAPVGDKVARFRLDQGLTSD